MKRLLGFFLLSFSLLLGTLTTVSNVHAQTVLKVGVLKTNKPYSSYSQHKYTGLDVSLAKKLGTELNRSVKIIAVKNHKQLFSKLRTHKIDIALGSSDTSIVPSEFSKTNSYLYPGNILFIRHDSKYKTITKLANHNVGMLKDNNQASLLTSLQMHPKKYKNMTSLLTALNKGKVKAAILSDYQYSKLLVDQPELVKANDPTNKSEVAQVLNRISDSQITSQQLVASVYHNKKLLQQLNTALQNLKSDGTISTLSERFLRQDWSYQ